MIDFFISILLYFYILLFRRGIRTAFPCLVSPLFVFNKTKKVTDVSLGKSFIGRDVMISDGCHFYDTPIVLGKVKIGRYTSINGPGTRICAFIHEINIGAFCSIASNVVIQEYNHCVNHVTTYNIYHHILNLKDSISISNTSKGPITIEDDVWIGSNVVILSGVKIGRGSVIGAGAVVVNDVPPYSVAVGNPARIVKKRFDDETISYIEKTRWWTWSIEEIKRKEDFFRKEFIKSEKG